MSLEEEKKLIEKSKSDPIAFGKLYDAYYPKISRYIFHRVGNVQTAQDITSDVFYKVMKALRKFEWRNSTFSAWIYKIASNEINNYYRRKKQTFLSLDILFEKYHFEIASDTNIEQEFIASEIAQSSYKDFLLIQEALQQLPIYYQEVLSLRFFEKKKIQEISQITGKNINTIKSLISRGIQKVKIIVQEREKDKSITTMQPFKKKNVIETKEKFL